MSKNTDKMMKAFSNKGCRLVNATWTPLGGSPIMCGPDGGWYLEYEDQDGFEDVILAYSTPEALEEIERLPDLNSEQEAPR